MTCGLPSRYATESTFSMRARCSRRERRLRWRQSRFIPTLWVFCSPSRRRPPPVRAVAIAGSVPQSGRSGISLCVRASLHLGGARGAVMASLSLRAVAPDRLSACVRIDEIRPQMLEARSEAERGVHVEVGRRLAEPLLEVQKLAKIFEAGSGRAVTALERRLDRGWVETKASGWWANRAPERLRSRAASSGSRMPTAGRIVIDGIEATDFQVLSEDDRRRCDGRSRSSSRIRTPP